MYAAGAQETQTSRVSTLEFSFNYLIDHHRYCSTHEQLQEKAHEKDIQIQNLLRQFDQLRTEQKIRLWVEKAHDPGMFGALKAFCNLFSIEQGQQVGTQTLKWDYKGKSPESAVMSFFRGIARPALELAHSNTARQRHAMRRLRSLLSIARYIPRRSKTFSHCTFILSCMSILSDPPCLRYFERINVRCLRTIQIAALTFSIAILFSSGFRIAYRREPHLVLSFPFYR